MHISNGIPREVCSLDAAASVFQSAPNCCGLYANVVEICTDLTFYYLEIRIRYNIYME